MWKRVVSKSFCGRGSSCEKSIPRAAPVCSKEVAGRAVAVMARAAMTAAKRMVMVKWRIGRV